jgi:hyperosmotically inducible protein
MMAALLLCMLHGLNGMNSRNLRWRYGGQTYWHTVCTNCRRGAELTTALFHFGHWRTNGMKTLFASMLGLALCIGAAQAADKPNAQASASTANPPRSTSADDASAQPGTDGWITTKVKAQLMTTKGIPSTDISVTTTNGIVTLSGVVDSKAQVQKSVAVAKAIKGVHKVDSSALTSRN